MCGRNSFSLISPKKIPTFLGSTGRPTTNDLTWTNHVAQQICPTTSTRLDNHSSNHQPIITKISPPDRTPRQVPKHLSINLGKLDHKSFISLLCEDIEANIPDHLDPNTSTVDQSVEKLTKAFRIAYKLQGRSVRTNSNRMKPLWDPEVLSPLVKEINTERCQMLKTRSQESKLLYYHHQQIFKQKVWELKTSHWRKCLADKGPEHAYQEYRFTREQASNKISALRDQEGHLVTEIAEKATILFEGTSLIPKVADLRNIPTFPPPSTQVQFPPVTEHKIGDAINKLPNKKVAGPEKILNELLKIAKDTITPSMSKIFNTFPQWKEALTTIIRKTSKDDYTDTNAYQPIVLLNTLGKRFEKIINNQLVYWAKQSDTLHPAHVGGRQGRSINNSFTILSTWIHHKWREKKIVAGLFLDVKLAYPTVYKERLIYSLRNKNCPTYLYLIIASFLTNRTTWLHLDQYFSQQYSIPNGLPQGSPLSVTLYLLYNSNLLLPNFPSLDKGSISIAYIDNVSHLLAEKSLKKGLESLEDVFQHSNRWREKNGAILDPKKTQVIVFTKTNIDRPLVQLGDQMLPLAKKVKWLGITLTSTLMPGEHLKFVKKHFNTTFTQLTRIICLTFGLNQKEARHLISEFLLTQVLHGRIIWYMTRNNCSINKLLTTWHHKAVCLCTGMMRQTPIAFLKH
ncbi:hypothetical protein O181_083458 [Austropuccinia psidii MF-1]|uniref:Reverse transcriptase domain-containing protein n=1 Tax=Austropuccinia psidii MF-1 TaxID=1389203 RepID=A0A9Q3IJK5_9BASI|nr:hypothetical protein [Austropuccinia psidii MF-1]